MIPARNAISLPNPQAGVNRDLRVESRRAVMFDSRLSFGARCLYFILDDHARGAGHCFASQKLLAGRLDMKERQLRTFMSELQARGYVSLRRGRRTAAEMGLFWADQDRQYLVPSL